MSDSDIIWGCILTRAELNVNLSSLLFIDMTAAVIRGGDLHCQVSCTVMLTVGEILHYDRNVTEKEGKNTRELESSGH